MRPGCLIVLLMALLPAAGCMHVSSPTVAAAPPALARDLDSLAYERRVTPPHARPSPQLSQQPGPQPGPPPVGATQAHAQAPVAVAVQPPGPSVYAVDTGDKLRIVVFGQDGLSNSYIVDAAGQVTIPLIGAVTARGLTTQQLARAVATKLRAGFIREPHVAIEVETYRPFFILGEVTQPGQYPFVPNMTIETAVAIAGGFTPRAYRHDVQLDRQVPGEKLRSRSSVPLLTGVQPGDTIMIKERWF